MFSSLPKVTTFRAWVLKSDLCSECNCPASCELQIVSLRSHSLIMNYPVSGWSWFTAWNHDILSFPHQASFLPELSPIHTSCPQTPKVSHRQCWAPVPKQCFSAGNTGTQTHLWTRTEPDSESTYHFVFKGSFKLQPSVAGAPIVNDNNNIA